MKKYKEFFEFIQKADAKFIDFRFTDMRGLWHHLSFPASSVDETLLEKGIFFDGSSIAGWQAIHESDMLLIPDLSRVTLDPFAAQTTIIVFCDVYDPVSHLPYDRDPRVIAKRAEHYLSKSGVADTAYFGPEAEFFIFDAVRFEVKSTSSFYEIAADELPQSGSKSSAEGNHGHRPQTKGGYLPVAPLDSLSDLRAEMVTVMGDMGVIVERHHHEVAPGQHEIGFKYGTLIETADNLQIYKYVVKNVADSYGKTATFMPKPIFDDNGSGMHVHQSLWKGETPLFSGKGYAGLSEMALYYIGGILKHAKVLNAFTNPTTNSYKRLVPGFEAPVILAYSERNRSAACRIPLSLSENSKRVEVRFPDPTANGYLAFAAMLMAGLDGIKNKIHPGDPSDYDLYEKTEKAGKLSTTCGSLRQSLEELEKSPHFLLKGDVFSEDFLKAYSRLKWDEVHALERSPHPLEFKLYYSS